MNAADRDMLTAFAAAAARFIQIPQPDIDPDLPAAEYIAAHDKAKASFTEFQRDQAIRLAGHLKWLAETGDTPLERRIALITKIMTDDMAGPLPYPVDREARHGN